MDELAAKYPELYERIPDMADTEEPSFDAAEPPWKLLTLGEPQPASSGGPRSSRAGDSYGDEEGNYGSEDRDMPEEIGEYVMSEESGNMRHLWEAGKTVPTDDIRAQARGSNLGGNETKGRMVVEDLFRRATEAGLTSSSDKTKPGLKTVQIVVKKLSTNGDFIHIEWELYNNEGDELRALRLHRQRQAAGSGSTGAKIVLDPADHSSLLLRDPTLQIPKRATASTIVALQDVLELRANAPDVAQQVPASVYSEFHAKLLRLYRAEVPPGFRPPTLLEIRKVDHDTHEKRGRPTSTLGKSPRKATNR
jgi:hypothetical protein